MDTYLFYDLETSGLHPAFDQVYQFAAIRTDRHFNELARYEFWIKPTIDIIPSPEALIVHRLPLEELGKKGEKECVVIPKIHALFNEPGTISLGYNTLGFDDEFLRFSFDRHLLTPYTHQFARQCRRMDLFPMVVFYYLFREEHLSWSFFEDKLSLKLEHLSLANDLAVGQAHRAMVDVEATLALAKKLASDSKMWPYLEGYFVKNTDIERLAKLPSVTINQSAYPYGVAVNTLFGYTQHYEAPVLFLGQHRHYRNQSIWLRLDDERLLEGKIPKEGMFWSVKKRPGEPPFLLPPEARYVRYAEAKERLSQESLAFLEAHPSFFEEIQNELLDATYPVYRETDIDAALYMRGFSSAEAVSFMEQFHRLTGEEKARAGELLKDRVLQERVLRYMGRFHGTYLSPEDRQVFSHYLEQIWGERAPPVDYKLQAKLTKKEALKKTETLLQESVLDQEQKGILEELKLYLSAENHPVIWCATSG